MVLSDYSFLNILAGTVVCRFQTAKHGLAENAFRVITEQRKDQQNLTHPKCALSEMTVLVFTGAAIGELKIVTLPITTSDVF